MAESTIEESLRVRELDLKEAELEQRKAEWKKTCEREEEKTKYDRKFLVRSEKNLTALVPLLVGAITVIIALNQIAASRYEANETRKEASKAQFDSAILNTATEEYKALLEARKGYFAKRDLAFDRFLDQATELELLARDTKIDRSTFIQKARALEYKSINLMGWNVNDLVESHNSATVHQIAIVYYDLCVYYYDKRHNVDVGDDKLGFLKQANKWYSESNGYNGYKFTNGGVYSGTDVTYGLALLSNEVAAMRIDEVESKGYPPLEKSVQQTVELMHHNH